MDIFNSNESLCEGFYAGRKQLELWEENGTAGEIVEKFAEVREEYEKLLFQLLSHYGFEINGINLTKL